MTRRNTKQREAIKEVFKDSIRPLSVPEVHEQAAIKSPSLGIATVYRNVNALVESGWLEVIEMPSEVPRYERGGQHHHHHFRCTGCERLYDLEGCLGNMETLVPKGFQLESHELLLQGKCGSCGDSK